MQSPPYHTLMLGTATLFQNFPQHINLLALILATLPKSTNPLIYLADLFTTAFSHPLELMHIPSQTSCIPCLGGGLLFLLPSLFPSSTSSHVHAARDLALTHSRSRLSHPFISASLGGLHHCRKNGPPSEVRPSPRSSVSFLLSQPLHLQLQHFFKDPLVSFLFLGSRTGCFHGVRRSTPTTATHICCPPQPSCLHHFLHRLFASYAFKVIPSTLDDQHSIFKVLAVSLYSFLDLLNLGSPRAVQPLPRKEHLTCLAAYLIILSPIMRIGPSSPSSSSVLVFPVSCPLQSLPPLRLVIFLVVILSLVSLHLASFLLFSTGAGVVWSLGFLRYLFSTGCWGGLSLGFLRYLVLDSPIHAAQTSNVKPHTHTSHNPTLSGTTLLHTPHAILFILLAILLKEILAESRGTLELNELELEGFSGGTLGLHRRQVWLITSQPHMICGWAEPGSLQTAESVVSSCSAFSRGGCSCVSLRRTGRTARTVTVLSIPHMCSSARPGTPQGQEILPEEVNFEDLCSSKGTWPPGGEDGPGGHESLYTCTSSHHKYYTHTVKLRQSVVRHGRT
ncbi:hypothetical protein GWK47_044658 [Chionoecetes opilio]|uniref:Uncharacterized protein n=1 Tax=Chionoecetes opilio TaxID=41210 RepID=A0A8J4Y8Z2_CHIOP|nr:hypothetical protein GWK47_044658 [Chionoecetes opilio]